MKQEKIFWVSKNKVAPQDKCSSEAYVYVYKQQQYWSYDYILFSFYSTDQKSQKRIQYQNQGHNRR